jgi:hypothetical protein
MAVTVKIKMKTTEAGAADHLHVQTYKAGETYDVPEALATAFVDHMKCADLVVTSRRADPLDLASTTGEAKMAAGAPENKMAAADAEEVKAPAAAPRQATRQPRT